MFGGSGKDNPFLNAVEESVKWKIEAQNRKQNEWTAQIEERISQNKRFIDSITEQCHNEFNGIKTQIVEVTADVLV